MAALILVRSDECREEDVSNVQWSAQRDLHPLLWPLCHRHGLSDLAHADADPEKQAAIRRRTGGAVVFGVQYSAAAVQFAGRQDDRCLQ